MGIILLSWAVMQSLGNWRILLALTALPALMVIASLKWYPESPRYCMVSKQYAKATKLLQSVAEMNGSNLPFGKLQELNGDVERGRFRDLFSKEFRKTTLLFWCIWLGIASTYYGIIFLTPTIIQKGGLMIEENSNNVSGNAIYSYNTSESDQREIDDVLKCTKLSNGNFFDLLWTSSAELPGILIFTFLVDCCSRKLLFGGSCIITALLTVLLLLDLEKIFLLIILFGARGILSANFQLVAIMTSEVFPTTIRAVAVGSGYAVCRLGCLTVPFLVQVLIASNPIPVISTLAALLFVCAVAVAFLPETKGAGLKESVQLQPKSKD
ncbi:synaptic vesicle 2-related protein-like isoform X2 [Parasteatoda tepidariorum]|uniref:synaptic vesicle 2-related protein-like isoform X2 n=1 Tax=Parasteatoda tepidariorum TaxID=114398 RepID=UPI001C71807E|nr:synaptic vesicle 2-related protein-like isoform X1 [Parasteatoda tepidariorum]XP_042903274.1 synaptic vesicle 2-related protein-like isoform X1 [Parasteatoda tepidariorum]